MSHLEQMLTRYNLVDSRKLQETCVASCLETPSGHLLREFKPVIFFYREERALISSSMDEVTSSGGEPANLSRSTEARGA